MPCAPASQVCADDCRAARMTATARVTCRRAQRARDKPELQAQAQRIRTHPGVPPLRPQGSFRVRCCAAAVLGPRRHRSRAPPQEGADTNLAATLISGCSLVDGRRRSASTHSDVQSDRRTPSRWSHRVEGVRSTLGDILSKGVDASSTPGHRTSKRGSPSVDRTASTRCDHLDGVLRSL